MKHPLTDKAQRFCEEYTVDLNATQAAIRAGYSSHTAAQTGHENLRKPEIAARINELRAKQTKKTEITIERVLTELAKIAFADMGSIVVNEGGKVVVSPRDKTAALQTLLKHLAPVADADDLAAAAIPFAQLVRQGLAKQRAKAAKG
jgi:phage terminase small subunit